MAELGRPTKVSERVTRLVFERVRKGWCEWVAAEPRTLAVDQRPLGRAARRSGCSRRRPPSASEAPPSSRRRTSPLLAELVVPQRLAAVPRIAPISPVHFGSAPLLRCALRRCVVGVCRCRFCLSCRRCVAARDTAQCSGGRSVPCRPAQREQASAPRDQRSKTLEPQRSQKSTPNFIRMSAMKIPPNSM